MPRDLVRHFNSSKRRPLSVLKETLRKFAQLPAVPLSDELFIFRLAGFKGVVGLAGFKNLAAGAIIGAKGTNKVEGEGGGV